MNFIQFNPLDGLIPPPEVVNAFSHQIDDPEARWILAEMCAKSFPGCRLNIEMAIGDYIPPEYQLLDDGIRGRMFSNGSSVVVTMMIP